MNLHNVDLRPTVATDRIYVSWTEFWGLERYVDHYLTTRKQPVNEELRSKIRGWIAKYPGDGPWTKANMDRFLDVNASKAL